MIPYSRSNGTTLYQGHVLDVLAQLEAESVQCVITSPPYFGLRNYGLPPVEWPPVRYAPMPGLAEIEVAGWSGSLGLEPTPEMYVGHLVLVFREARRVLRDDGVCWMVIGDSYATGGGKVGRAPGGGEQGERWGKRWADVNNLTQPNRLPIAGLKPKDLCGIPWRVAFALQADGWYLRSDIIWAKGVSFCPSYSGSSMPESVKDRPSRSHETVFLLAKSARYFYDSEAVEEQSTDSEYREQGHYRPSLKTFCESETETDKLRGRLLTGLHKQKPSTTRNLRSVWAINPRGYPGSHFATFPPALIEPMVLAGTSEKGCCPECKAPWLRVVDVKYRNPGNRTTNGPRGMERRHESPGFPVQLEREATTLGWRPGCACDANPRIPIPCTILDPFAGSGTTADVCREHHRDCILIELSRKYCDEHIIPRLERPIQVTLRREEPAVSRPEEPIQERLL